MAQPISFPRPEEPVNIPVGPVELHGNLSTHPEATGIVVFAHGSGSSRHSPRNRYVAHELQKTGLATLLLDLLTEEEEGIDIITREFRFDIGLLADRLEGTAYWLNKNPATANLKIGYFGASTGAAAALMAASRTPGMIHAVVSRGGRPDLAGESIPRVTAPTLLIVGGDDEQVITLNEQAKAKMTAETELIVVPGASHLFEEPGKLAIVAQLASDWFCNFLAPVPLSRKR